MTEREAVRGLVLAGGKALRMRQADKALIDFQGLPLLAHVLKRLRPQVEDVWLNVNRNQHRYEEFGLRLLGDQNNHAGRGPLAGIHAGLSYSAARHPGWLLVCPCDSPFLLEDLSQRLLNAAVENGQRAAVVHDGDRLHPVFCLLHSDLLPELEAHLHGGPGSVHAWLEVIAATVVDFSDAPPRAFANINTPDDLWELRD